MYFYAVTSYFYLRRYRIHASFASNYFGDRISIFFSSKKTAVCFKSVLNLLILTSYFDLRRYRIRASFAPNYFSDLIIIFFSSEKTAVYLKFVLNLFVLVFVINLEYKIYMMPELIQLSLNLER